MTRPLADRIRPNSLDTVVGQHHILGEGKLLTNIIKTGDIPNMIFYGPSGTGKTTLANICASVSNKTFYKINATNSSIKDIKHVIEDLDKEENATGVLLYLDEIQNFNKKQQQSILEFIENGSITLIASTTENPYFYVYNAILSRSLVVEFKPVDYKDILSAVERGIELIKEDYPEKTISFDDDAKEHIAFCSGGDVRRALNAVEVCVKSQLFCSYDDLNVDLEVAKSCTQRSSFAHDKNGDSHYDVISAFQKSIRGSDPHAAIHYLARLLEGGDLITACRRLLVIASEDVGLAYPNAIVVAKACVDSALQLGLPEARIPLAEAVIFLSCLPKSNSAICAIDDAISDISNGNSGPVPSHLCDAHYGGASKLGRGTEYKYPHNFKNAYVNQQYLPDNIKDKVYYEPKPNKTEDNFKKYLDILKEGK